MDIGWALAAVRDGKAVRRRAWDLLMEIPEESTILTLERPAPDYSEVLVITMNNGRKTLFTPSHVQLLADDWELA